MPATLYSSVLADRRTRKLFLVSFLLRIPMFAVAVSLTLHVVEDLQRGWAQAGLVAGVSTLCVAISGPWRGRLLDRLGLRRVVGPSILITAICWSIAPFSSYPVLLALAAISGLFSVPSFVIIRQALVAATTSETRRSALALDSVIQELSFMAGPMLGVALTTSYDSAWVIFGFQMAIAFFAAMLWLLNPPLRTAESDGHPTSAQTLRRADWVSRAFVGLCLIGFAMVIVVNSTDVALVAAARHLQRADMIGLVMALWGLGSVVGGLIYGSLRRPPSLRVLLGILAVSTAVIAVANSVLWLAILGFISGLCCAPTMTSALDALTRAVDERARGEATGWFGSAQTLGGAVAAPLAGWCIDAFGPPSAFVMAGGVGVAVLVVSPFFLSRSRPPGPPASSSPEVSSPEASDEPGERTHYRQRELADGEDAAIVK